MKKILSIGIWLLLIPFQFLLIYFFKNNTAWVEHYYTHIFYFYSSQALRYTLGAIPFSVGDLLYIIAVIYLIIKLFKIYKGRKSFIIKLREALLFKLKAVLLFFFFFNLAWGFNNYRTPLHEQLGIATHYTQQDLLAITDQLVEKANNLQLRITADSITPVTITYSTAKILQDAEKGIHQLNDDLNWGMFKNPSIKKSLWSLPLTYMGFSGYLNPFTNEAQVNYKIPKLGMIVTAAHETAHQMGIAKESDANLLGYLGALKQEDIHYQYAATIYALRYCLRTLERDAYADLQIITAKTTVGVLYNLNENPAFWSQYKGISSMFFKMFYGNFLKATNQKEGIHSYNRFVDLLINYHKTVPL